jgi:hypothetical protein
MKKLIISVLLMVPAVLCQAADYYCGQDGFADRVIVRDDGSGNALWIAAASSQDSFGDGIGELSGTFGLVGDYHMLGDVNGDGYTDRIVARVHSSGNYLWWEVSYSGPRGFGTSGVNASGSFGSPTMIPYAVDDLNGDGLGDCIALGYNASGDRTYYVKYSDGGFLAGAGANKVWGGTNTETVGIADVNNDGIGDRVDYFGGAGWRADFGPSAGGFGDSVADLTGYYGGDVTRLIADVNGDGYADRIIASLNASETYYNWSASITTESGWGTSGTDYTQIAPFGEPGDKLLVADVLTPDVPFELQYLAPYTDSFGTNGLWHFDEIIDAGGGKLITPDDDSENPGRNHDMVLRNGVDLATLATGPQLVYDPIGDPGNGDPNFANCLQFNGFSQSLWVDTLLGDTLGVNDGNLRVEAWVKFEGEQYQAGDEYFIACHNDRFRLRYFDHSNMGFLVGWIVFDSDGVARPLNVAISFEGAQQWNHIAGTYYNGTSSLYFNGEMIASLPGLTPTINAATTPRVTLGAAAFGGSPSNYFLGKIDEVRIGQAVPTEPECGYWGYSPADINKDCYVDFADLKQFVSQWLDCTIPGEQDCLSW